MTGFRESAKPAVVADDPHGARAAAFALPERLRDAIDRPNRIDPPRPRDAFFAIAALFVGVLAAVALVSPMESLWPLLLVLPGVVLFWLVWPWVFLAFVSRAVAPLRFRFTPKALFVVRGKDEERFPWTDVEAVRLRGPFVECRVRRGERARVIWRLRPVLHWLWP